MKMDYEETLKEFLKNSHSRLRKINSDNTLTDEQKNKEAEKILDAFMEKIDFDSIEDR